MPIGVPKVLYRLAGEEEEDWIDLYNCLYRQRMLFLCQELDDELGNQLISLMLYLNEEDPDEPFFLYINSPGGSVTCGIGLYDVMRKVAGGVTTLCVGLAASMSSFVLAGGTFGRRLCFPNARMMIHQPEGGSDGQASEIIFEATEVRRIRQLVGRIYSSRTGQSVYRIARDMDRDEFMGPKEAVSYGLVDAVVIFPENEYEIIYDLYSQFMQTPQFLRAVASERYLPENPGLVPEQPVTVPALPMPDLVPAQTTGFPFPIEGVPVPNMPVKEPELVPVQPDYEFAVQNVFAQIPQEQETINTNLVNLNRRTSVNPVPQPVILNSLGGSSDPPFDDPPNQDLPIPDLLTAAGLIDVPTSDLFEDPPKDDLSIRLAESTERGIEDVLTKNIEELSNPSVLSFEQVIDLERLQLASKLEVPQLALLKIDVPDDSEDSKVDNRPIDTINPTTIDFGTLGSTFDTVLSANGLEPDRILARQSIREILDTAREYQTMFQPFLQGSNASGDLLKPDVKLDESEIIVTPTLPKIRVVPTNENFSKRSLSSLSNVVLRTSKASQSQMEYSIDKTDRDIFDSASFEELMEIYEKVFSKVYHRSEVSGSVGRDVDFKASEEKQKVLLSVIQQIKLEKQRMRNVLENSKQLSPEEQDQAFETCRVAIDDLQRRARSLGVDILLSSSQSMEQREELRAALMAKLFKEFDKAFDESAKSNKVISEKQLVIQRLADEKIQANGTLKKAERKESLIAAELDVAKEETAAARRVALDKDKEVLEATFQIESVSDSVSDTDTESISDIKTETTEPKPMSSSS